MGKYGKGTFCLPLIYGAKEPCPWTNIVDDVPVPLSLDVHQHDLLQGYEKNPERLKESSVIILGWISDIDDFLHLANNGVAGCEN